MTHNIEDIAQKCKQASRVIATLSGDKRTALLHTMADNLITEMDAVLVENEKDLKAATENGMTEAMVDRLRLTPDRIEAIAQAVREVAAQSDPVGEIKNLRKRPNGIQVGKMRIPLGVIGIIYESRPNVTVDAAALCIKAGNAVILRGGSEAFHSNMAISAVLGRALEKAGLPAEIVSFIPTTDREMIKDMLVLDQWIDVIIPRGGENLIRFVVENSRIPVIKHYKGVCHLYADQDADLNKLVPLVVNGKTHRPGVCNALETVLVHRQNAETVIPAICEALAEKGVEIRACAQTQAFWSAAKTADESDYAAEFLSLILAVRVVEDYDQAIKHIQQYGSDHTEVIVTEKLDTAQKFLQDVQSSVVMVNASSRFSDGGELGLGAEIGISTSKLHAYGPMGVESLTTEKFIVLGKGQIR